MMRSMLWSAGLLAVALGSGAHAADYPQQYRHHHRYGAGAAAIGTCVRTRVATIASPAQPVPALQFTDGVVQGFDGDMLGHVETRVGDPIQLCLVSFTRDCGNNDVAGRTYATADLRTGAAWTLPDLRASCPVR